HVEGEVRASTIVIAEGAQIEGEVSADELTVGGYVKGTLHADRVTVNSTAVIKGDIFHRTLMIEGGDAGMKSARAIVRWNRYGPESFLTLPEKALSKDEARRSQPILQSCRSYCGSRNQISGI